VIVEVDLLESLSWEGEKLAEAFSEEALVEEALFTPEICLLLFHFWWILIIWFLFQIRFETIFACQFLK